MIKINLMPKPKKQSLWGWHEGPCYSLLDSKRTALGIVVSEEELEEMRRKNEIKFAWEK